MLLGRPGELECVAAPLKGDSDLVSGLCCKKRFKAVLFKCHCVICMFGRGQRSEQTVLL